MRGGIRGLVLGAALASLSACGPAVKTEKAAGSEALPEEEAVMEEEAQEQEWLEERFEGALFPPAGSPKARAVVRDGLLHVVDEGTQSGDMVTLQRDWYAVPEMGSAVEARVRVVSCEGMAGVMLGFSDGVHEDLLTLYTDRIELHHAGLSHAMDTTDGFHVYRVDIRDNDVTVMVDGEEVIQGAGGFTHPAHAGRNRVSIGAGSSAATGEAYWDWIRWTVVPVTRSAHELDVPDAEHIVVFKEPDLYACFPSLQIDPETGFLFTGFSAKQMASHHASPGDRRVRMESRDGGRNWTAVERFPAGVRGVRPGPEFPTPDGALMRFGSYGWRWMPKERRPEFEGRYRLTQGSPSQGPSPDHFAILTGGFVERSEDNGRNWKRTAIPELDTYTSWSSPWSYARFPDGTAIRAYMVLRGGGEERHQVYVALTRDGENVEVVHVMGEQPGGPLRFTEETLVHVTSRGVAWMLTRVHGEGDYLWQAVSEDGGSTWTSRRTDIAAGQSPPSGLVELEDGRLVLIYGYRRSPHGIRALVSEDEGLTWRMDRELVLRDDGAGFDLGYPWATLLPDGTILTIYYYHTADQVRHIACTRFTVPDFE